MFTTAALEPSLFLVLSPILLLLNLVSSAPLGKRIFPPSPTLIILLITKLLILTIKPLPTLKLFSRIKLVSAAMMITATTFL